MKKGTLRDKVANRIKRSKADVFIMPDFADLGAYDYILSILRGMVQAGQLIKIGRGIYAKVWVDENGEILPIRFIGDLARQALEKYGVKTNHSSYWHAYNADLSTQVPSGRRIAVSRRVRRKIGYNDYCVNFEFMGARYKQRWLSPETVT